jgi:hypothetical protein
MSIKKCLVAAMVTAFVATGCGYIVPPPDDSTPTPASDHGWGAVVTGVSETGAALHVDIAIRNDTSDWSSLQAASSGSANVTVGGKSSDCGTVYVGTGQTSLAPGFIMRGYTGGTAAKPVTQLLYVECAGVAKAAGMTLAISYSYLTGPFNYYSPNKPGGATFQLDLDKVVSDGKYPVATTVAKTVLKPDAPIPAINDYTVQLVGTKRTATGLEFTWETKNPSDYPGQALVGSPQVIGADGVIYGLFEAPNLADAPIVLAKDKASSTSEVVVPADVKGLYILVSVETNQHLYFVNYAVDITDK